MENFLRKLLLPIADNNEDVISKLTDEESMKIWTKAFTHESYNPNFGENYEELELLGDSVIRTIFLDYIMKMFPDADRSMLSEFAAYYLKGYTLHQLADKLQLRSYIRTRISTAIKLDEDVFEAFFGALFILGNERITYGTGFVLCSTLLYSLLNEVELNSDIVKHGDPHGRLINYFTMIGARPNDIIERWLPKENRIIISLSTDLIQRLNSLGVIRNNPILVDMVVGTRGKRESKLLAYGKAIDELASIGLTEEWFRTTQFRIELSDPVIRDLYNRVLNLVRQRGYERIELYNPRYSKKVLGKSTLYIEVLGIDKNGKKTVLSIGDGPTIRDAKIKALNNYIQHTLR